MASPNRFGSLPSSAPSSAARVASLLSANRGGGVSENNEQLNEDAAHAKILKQLSGEGYNPDSNPAAWNDAAQVANKIEKDDNAFKDMFFAHNVLELPSDLDAFTDLENTDIREADYEFGQISEYLIGLLEKPFSFLNEAEEDAGVGVEADAEEDAGVGVEAEEDAGVGVGAEAEARINQLVDLANKYDSDLAYLSLSFEDAGRVLTAPSDRESVASSSVSIIVSQQIVQEITQKTDTMIELTKQLLDNKSKVVKTQIKTQIIQRRKSALDRLLEEAQKVHDLPAGSSRAIAAASAEAAAGVEARHLEALIKRRKTLQGKAAAAAAASAAASAGSVAGLSHSPTDLTLGQAIQVPLVGQRIEGPSPDDQARFAHGESILNQRRVPCDICDRIITEKFQFDHSLPVNYEAFTCRIFLGYKYNRTQTINYWEGELIHLIQFLGGPAHQSCNGSKGKKKGLTCPIFNEQVGFSHLTENIDSLLDITYTKLLNDAVLVKDVVAANIMVPRTDFYNDINVIISNCLKEHPTLNNLNIKKIIYYIAQRLSFSVAKLRPVKHFMKTNLDYTKVNDRLKYVRGKQAEAKAKVGVVTAATNAAAAAASIETVPNIHVERLASARAAIEALRGTGILPYKDDFEKGQQINFNAPAERKNHFPELPFFRPTESVDGVLPPMKWKDTTGGLLEEEQNKKINELQRVLIANRETILNCAKNVFDKIPKIEGCGPAANRAIENAKKANTNMKTSNPPKPKRFKLRGEAEEAEEAAAEGPARVGEGGMGNKRQRKTRQRKHTTRKRKTRKNRR
jgi:hypothetical protein